MAMPLPPFHAHMHMAACQAQNTLSRVPAGGTGIGEPTEQINRFLGLAGVVLQYATLSARALWLEVLFRRWNVRTSFRVVHQMRSCCGVMNCCCVQMWCASS
jgi:hypothetical protein